MLMWLFLPLWVGAASPTPTFTDTDPVTGRQVECDSCPPGTYLRARCTSTRKSECAPCPSGSFTELWNYIDKCLRCGVCGHNQVEKTACSPDSDRQCECKQGYHYEARSDMCVRHSECPPGQEVLSRGTPDKDTVCRICPNGTFSVIASAHHNCSEHRSCNAAGLVQVLKGSTWHDSVCASYGELSSKDGADYLREILPAFFVHQKMSIRRLRRIVHHLNRPDGHFRHNLSDLHVQINSWVTSATPEQIRQLPDILMKAGVNGAAERLQNKLQRIDSNLQTLGNEMNEGTVLISRGNKRQSQTNKD